MYDKDFEKFWNETELQFKTPKDFAYVIWQSARATKPEKQPIELEGGEWFINSYGEEQELVSTTQYRILGKERKTEADATKAAELMRKRDRLAAFVYEHCGDEGEFKEGVCNYSIIGPVEKTYFIFKDNEPDLCKQYMTKDTAIWLCEKLNSGEIVL